MRPCLRGVGGRVHYSAERLPTDPVARNKPASRSQQTTTALLDPPVQLELFSRFAAIRAAASFYSDIWRTFLHPKAIDSIPRR